MSLTLKPAQRRSRPPLTERGAHDRSGRGANNQIHAFFRRPGKQPELPSDARDPTPTKYKGFAAGRHGAHSVISRKSDAKESHPGDTRFLAKQSPRPAGSPAAPARLPSRLLYSGLESFGRPLMDCSESTGPRQRRLGFGW